MYPVTEHTIEVAASRQLRVKDECLARVLAGEEFLLFDGAMGTMLQRSSSLKAGELPELLCLTEPDAVTAVHRAYVEAGSMAVTTNTFGANARKLGANARVQDIFDAAIGCARQSGARYVAADIGPLGALLEPMGTLSFSDAYDLFAEQVRAADTAGADLIIIETMTDLLEAKAAVLAAKENSALPVFATMTFEESGKSFLGAAPDAVARTLEALSVDALGINCSLGPTTLRPILQQMLEVTSCPVIVQANAGLPQVVGGVTTYPVGPEEYCAAVSQMIKDGAGIVGGCCGTSPDHIRGLARLIAGDKPRKRSHRRLTSLTSARECVELDGNGFAVVGERINPTGRPDLKDALLDEEYDDIVDEALSQVQAGAALLDVNASLPELDEPEVLAELVKQIQEVCSVPLQIDSDNPAALEAAVRSYNGKPLINSVNGTKESLEAILPLARHYGCAVIGLTLDERGVPSTARERLEIARKIVEAASAYGIPREDVIIDCVVTSAATDQHAVSEILQAVFLVKRELGVKTALGISNISFGLPARKLVNATFLSAALACGLDLPIVDPQDARCKEVLDTWRVFNAQDAGAHVFVGAHAAGGDSHTALAPCDEPAEAPSSPAPSRETAGTSRLHALVVEGNKHPVADEVAALLESVDAMEVVNGHLIPALDEVGELFESGRYFLPQLIASAEAAKEGFEAVRSAVGSLEHMRGPIVLATVRGDIHDIGKNIVAMLLENYGYRIIDLGRDVDPQAVVDAVNASDAKLVGLSALMTTTMESMKLTIDEIRSQCPQGVKVMVGGAVLNEEYAQMVGADYYAKDAMESARIASEVCG